jgi:hypothetical protein
MALVSFRPENREFRVLPFTFQDENKGWELISLVPNGETANWQLAWKKSGQEKTEYRYTVLSVDDWRETEIGEQEFLSRMMPEYGVKAPAEIQRLLLQFSVPGEKPVIDVILSFSDGSTPQEYRFGDVGTIDGAEDRIIRLRAFRYEGVLYLLLPGGELWWMDGDGEKGMMLLPPLPEGYTYTDFISDGNTVFALWEEQDFVTVRHAGFLISRRKM